MVPRRKRGRRIIKSTIVSMVDLNISVGNVVVAPFVSMGFENVVARNVVVLTFVSMGS